MELNITLHPDGFAKRADRELQGIFTERGVMFVVAYSLLILAILWYMAGAMSIVRFIVDVAEPLLILAPMIVTTRSDSRDAGSIASVAIYSALFIVSAAIMIAGIWVLFGVEFDMSRLVGVVATMTIEVAIATSIGVVFATLLHRHRVWFIILVVTLMSTSMTLGYHSHPTTLLAISLFYIIMSEIAEKYMIIK